jgi:hypothetical protein
MYRRRLFLFLTGMLALGWTACAPTDTAAPVKKIHTPEVHEANYPPIKLELPLKDNGLDPLRNRIEAAIKNVRDSDLLTKHGFWTVFHGILGLGPKTELLDPATNKRVNAIDYICQGGTVRGMEFIPTEFGLDVMTATTPDMIFVGQGHQDQFIAEMTQWGMPADKKFRVLGKEYTFRDFVNNSRMRASLKGGQELSWTILVLGQYVSLDLDTPWKNKDGEELTFRKLLEYELDASMDKAACGGTHRLFDLAWVEHLHRKRGGKTEGIWKRVADNTAHYQDVAKKLQNTDGSFSSEFFKERGWTADPQRRINTTGHTFEWLALTLPDSRLREPWVEEAANALTKMILDLRGDPMEGGTLYHAAHGLIIYHARVYDRAELARDLSMLPLPPEE